MLLVTMGIITASCSTTKELPPVPQYSSRNDYPNLLAHDDTLGNDFRKPQPDLTSFDTMYDHFKDYTHALGCRPSKSRDMKVIVNIIVTENGESDAPKVVESPSEACSESMLRAVQFLKFTEPARVDGNPVPYIYGFSIIVQHVTISRGVVN